MLFTATWNLLSNLPDPHVNISPPQKETHIMQQEAKRNTEMATLSIGKAAPPESDLSMAKLIWNGTLYMT
jgi:hypothetical protein